MAESNDIALSDKIAPQTKPSELGDGILEITDLDGFLDALRNHLAPVFEEQAAVWEREGPAAEARAMALGITIDGIGGNCPVQAEGSFDERRFYFRARGDEWQFHIWPTDKAPRFLDLPFGQEERIVERGYGSGFEAGWMHKHEAIGFICDAVEAFRGQAI